MNKVELVNTLRKGFEMTGRTVPENFDYLPIDVLRAELTELKDTLKDKGLQPNKVINALKTNDNEYLANIGIGGTGNRNDSGKPRFQRIETGEPGGTEPGGTEPGGTEQPETETPETDEIPESSETEHPEVEKELFPDIETDIAEHLRGYQSGTGFTSEPEQPKKRKRRSRQPKIDSEGLVTGYLLLFVTNMVFPQLASFVFNTTSKKQQVDSKAIALNDEQLTELRPIADAAADYIQVKINPLVLFGVMTSVMYTSNIAENVRPKTRLKVA